jgi:hypothetical protein
MHEYIQITDKHELTSYNAQYTINGVKDNFQRKLNYLK